MHQEHYDEFGNLIDTTLYESYLSKLIVEHPEFYIDVFEKINRSIVKFIEKNNTPSFDRFSFSVFSEFSRVFPRYQSIDDLLTKTFNVQGHVQFHKVFFEMLFTHLPPPPPLLKDPKKLYTLAELAQFVISANNQKKIELKTLLRPKSIFSPSGRSRDEISGKTQLTTKLGIASTVNTPPNLQSYFNPPYESAQSQFRRDPEGFFSKWLKKRDLPFISGPSGTLQINFSHIIQLDTYSPSELKKYFMGLAASLVSRGHHSFIEVMIVAKQIGFDIKDTEDRKSFYEQFLTPEFIDSTIYRDFLTPNIEAVYIG